MTQLKEVKMRNIFLVFAVLTSMFTMQYLIAEPLTKEESIVLQKNKGFEMVKDAAPLATIILPEETEFDHYLKAAPEDIDALARKRFPKASPEKLELVKKNLPAEIKKEAKRVGDEEKLADGLRRGGL